MINKRSFRKANDKKILHKIGKQWVTVSITMLALLGGGIAASHVTHAASTTPVTKLAVTQSGNNAKPQSVSSSTVASATPASIALKSIPVASNNLSESQTSDHSYSFMSQLMNIMYNNIQGGTNETGAKCAYSNLMNIISPENLAHVSNNKISATDWYGYLTRFQNDLTTINNNGDSNPVINKTLGELNDLETHPISLGFFGTYTLKKNASQVVGMIPSYSLNDLATRFDTPGGFAHSILFRIVPDENKLDQIGTVMHVLKNVANNTKLKTAYSNVVNDLTNLPNQTKAQQVRTLSKLSNHISNFANDVSIQGNDGLPSQDKQYFSGITSNFTKASHSINNESSNLKQNLSTDTINYQYQDQTEASQQFINHDYQSVSLAVTNANDPGLPSGYRLVNSNNSFSYDGNSHNVAITPIQKTDTVNYVDGAATVASHQFTGNDVFAQDADNTSFDASAEIPNGYQLANGANANFGYDGQTHSVAVVRAIQPAPAPQPTPTPMPSPNPMPDVMPMPSVPQLSANSALVSNELAPTQVVSSRRKSVPMLRKTKNAHVVKPRHNKKSTVAKLIKINVPSVKGNVVIRVGKRHVTVRNKVINHARVYGFVQRGHKIVYMIKIGKRTGYVWSNVNKITKPVFNSKRTYLHVGKKVIKLNKKSLKHVKVLSITKVGNRIKYYVKINHRYGNIYAKSRNVLAYITVTDISRYYHAIPKHDKYVKITKGLNVYRNRHFSRRNRCGYIKSGTTVKIKRIVKNGKAAQFQLANGYYITANKHFTKFIF